SIDGAWPNAGRPNTMNNISQPDFLGAIDSFALTVTSTRLAKFILPKANYYHFYSRRYQAILDPWGDCSKILAYWKRKNRPIRRFCGTHGSDDAPESFYLVSAAAQR
ncbi:hypothetical protein N9P94_04115, partial [Pseudomonadales bacterium]|nr:hypothetical protein [Pseudomonadales bacterium]